MPRRQLVHFSAALLLMLLPSLPAHAASFDCKRAKTAVEKMICGSEELSTLDDQLANAYTQALVAAPDRDVLKKKQKTWVKNVRNNCKNIECLKVSYINQTQKLKHDVESNKMAVNLIKNDLIGDWESYGRAFYNTGIITITHSGLYHELCKVKFKLISTDGTHYYFKAETQNSCRGMLYGAINYIKIINRITKDDQKITVRYYSDATESSLLGEGTYDKLQ